VIGDPRAAHTARIPAEQIGGDPRFVDEDESVGELERLLRTPPSSCGRDISATLFGGVYGFF